MESTYKSVATALRLEFEENSNRTYIIFEVTDEEFRQKIMRDFSQDMELLIRNKNANV